MRQRVVQTSKPVIEQRTAEPRQTPTQAPESRQPTQTATNKRPPRKHISKGLLAFLVFGFIVIGFAGSYLMGGATITVYPRFFEPNLNATFTAYKEAPAGELGYEVMTLDATGERQVKATGQEDVKEQAKGTVTIYKSTPGTQRLIKNTRLQDASGKIFRITESVVVPGSTDGTPGSVTADVFADEPGEDYNLAEKTRFTIPGLESDTALFNAIYAENDAAFTGGFVGQKFILDDAQLGAAQESLHEELKQTLLDQLPEKQPSNMILFNDAVTFTYESLPSVAYGEDMATIKEKAILQVPLFKKDDFATYLATATIPSYDGASVRLDKVDAITFTYTNPDILNTNLSSLPNFEFSLKGRPILVYTFDKTKLASDLTGIQRGA